MDYFLTEDETIEDLQLNGLHLIQKKKAFRFGMDSVLLAHFAGIKSNDTVVDFGTGNGILIFLLYGRNKGSRYYAVDILEESAELARRNTSLNGMEDKVTVIQSDAGDISRFIPAGSIDAAVCNPPYGHHSAALTSPNRSKAIARSQDETTLDRFFLGAFSVLKGKGKLFIVYPASQLLFLMTKLRSFHLEPKRFQLVYPYSEKPANLVLLEAVKDAKPTLHPMPPLIVYNKDGSLTNDLKSVYHII